MKNRIASRCAQRAPRQEPTGREATDDTVRWARSLADMPDWVVATSYALSLGDAQRVQAVVARVLVEMGGAR